MFYLNIICHAHGDLHSALGCLPSWFLHAWRETSRDPISPWLSKILHCLQIVGTC